MDSVNSAGHDPNSAVCWAPSNPYFQSAWSSGSTHSISVTTFNTGVNGGANQSDDSQPLSYVFVPAPTGVQLWNECGREWQITWTPAPGAATYNIYANGTLIAEGLTTAVDTHGNESVPFAQVSNPIWDATAC